MQFNKMNLNKMTSNLRFLQRKLGYIRSCPTIFRRNIYEGDGKTTVKILNQELESGLMINGYSQIGFRLNNGLTVIGPMAIFPRTVLSWNVADINDINEETLSLFFVLEPKLDILVLGIGDSKYDISFSSTILRFMRKYKINVEILTTKQACATFNFLNGEGRYVAGALIPPAHVSVTDDDVIQSKLRHQQVYLLDD